jgi:hypothetical protein
MHTWFVGTSCSGEQNGCAVKLVTVKGWIELITEAKGDRRNEPKLTNLETFPQTLRRAYER